MSISREQLEFGAGSFVGKALNDPEFYELSIRDQARIVGWAVGCPVVERLTDPANPDVNRGPEAMLGRYSEIAFWYGFIARDIQKANPELYRELTTPLVRWDDEPVGEYEPQSVPEDYQYVIPPTEKLAGYVLPRLLIKQLGDRNLPEYKVQARLERGLRILDKAITQAQTPEELVALVADGVIHEDVDPVTALSTVLPEGWFEEHNATRMLNDMKGALKEKAPYLWLLYGRLSEEEKIIHRII